MNRRRFLGTCLIAAAGGAGLQAAGGDAKKPPAPPPPGDGRKPPPPPYDPDSHCFGMGIDIAKCIGCGRCLDACKTENDVPPEPFFVRTWVERYTVKRDGNVVVQNLRPADGRGPETAETKDTLRSFFVPKLCNHCADAPCVQVCPVGATFSTKDGVVLVDADRCVGCRYCIQACPYGARFLHPVTRTAEKCTFCYHRVRKGLLPACVEVCPTQARVFGDLKSIASPLTRFRRMHKIHTLKPNLNTEPKVLYANLDGEVR